MSSSKEFDSSKLSASEKQALNNFVSLLKIPTISHMGIHGAYKDAVELLKKLCEELGMKTQVYQLVQDKPILIATLQGANPRLPSVILNSHYDVVPVVEHEWIHPPFEAQITADGDIYARGTQDMKSVCVQYLEAIRRLIASKAKLERTIHLCFVPDEEIGGVDGMKKFVETDDFKALNAGVALDEGLTSDTDELCVFYSERTIWWLQIDAVGPTGHASRFIPNTAVEKLLSVVRKFLDLRAKQEQRLLESERAIKEHNDKKQDKCSCSHGKHDEEVKKTRENEAIGCAHAQARKLRLGDVLTLNLTALQAGVTSDGGKTYSLNVVPDKAMAGFDIRVPLDIDLTEFEAQIKEWTNIDGVSYKFIIKNPMSAVSSTDEKVNPYYRTFAGSLRALGINFQPAIFPAATDGRYMRIKGVPTFGFSPIPNTPVLLHDHNERINVQTFLKGIGVYERIISDLANMQQE